MYVCNVQIPQNRNGAKGLTTSESKRFAPAQCDGAPFGYLDVDTHPITTTTEKKDPFRDKGLSSPKQTVKHPFPVCLHEDPHPTEWPLTTDPDGILN